MTFQSVDIERCRRGMKQLVIRGVADNGVRGQALADAISLIQANPRQALMKEYIGVKQYSGFGYQREDHQYNYGPRHGTIYFSIGRAPQQGGGRFSGPIDADAVYLLEAYRDCEQVMMRDESGPPLSLTAIIQRLDKAEGEARMLREHLAAMTVESHEAEPPAEPQEE